MGGKVDHSINVGRAPYVYRLNGQNHHVFGTLIPDEGDDLKFCQLYIYDTEHEVENQMKWVKVDDGEAIDTEIVEGLVLMLDDTNQLVKKFHYVRDRFKEQPIRDLKIKLKVSRSESGRENIIGPSDEVACVMVGDIDTTMGERDIIAEKKADENDRDIVMEKSNKNLERISYVHPSLMALQYPILFPFGEDGYHDEIPYVDSETKKTQENHHERILLLSVTRLHVRLGGRLYQQYVVDAYSCIEQARLWWLRTHKTNLRSDLYTTLAKKVVNGGVDAANVGKGFVLPTNFLGSKRYMQQNFQDTLAVCRVVGHPDVFLTMTFNSQWNEINEMMKSLPGCSAHDSPDIIARVFHLKLEQLIDDIKNKRYFGNCIGVEFQKRGLPHVHMLIWLDAESKRNLTANVDKYVSAEIPDPINDPVAYDAGHNRATVEISSQRTQSVNEEQVVDEIKAYFDGRYICASEAAYRILSFPIHYRSISVLRLSFHLLGEKSCTFTESDNLERVVRREQYKHSQLEAFFLLNQTDPNSRRYTYDEIPQYYVWNETDRIWTMRKKGKQIGRMLYTHHTAGELWYLRLLFSNVRGPTSFQSLKTINGVCCRTFKDACKILGLLDDNEWHSVLRDCSVGGFPEQIRQLFVHIIVNCQVTYLKRLWQ
ncbi:uncharacterized protein LOC141659946 [Apium graveolens]|uniref:uncharacterized protein LOC141659946 n=1 Tax=Apium graveolens TaxID=4045 RepID=UPI003D7AB8E0